MIYPVWYAAAANYKAETLNSALKKALEPALAAAGTAAQKRIMIKPNFLEYKAPGDPASVNPDLLVALVRYLRVAGAAEIAIIETPGTDEVAAVLKRMGIADELEKLGATAATCRRYEGVDMPEDAAFRHVEMATEFRDYDLVIDLAKAKTHVMMTLTLAVKNLFGLIRGSERLGWHLAVGRDRGRFADLLLDLYLEVKPHISLIDAIIGMEGDGPGSGTPIQCGFIAASNDALAIDAALTKRFGVANHPVLERAAARQLLPDFDERGDVPEVIMFKLPPPPSPGLEWGVWLPRGIREYLRGKMVSKPTLNATRCIGCGTCAKMCPPQTLKMQNHRPVFDLKGCIRCYCCQEHCPCGAIIPQKTTAMKAAGKLEKLVRRLGVAAAFRKLTSR